MMHVILAVSLTVSVMINLGLSYLLKSKSKAPKQSEELQQFLGDLLSGPGIVAVSRINPQDILLRSPKNR